MPTLLTQDARTLLEPGGAPPAPGRTDRADAALDHASERDLPELTRLLGSSVPDCSPQTVWDLPWTVDRFRVVRDADGGLLAAGMLAALDADRLEIRGLAVAKRARGRGLGRLVMTDLLVAADATGLETVCMTRRPAFFRRFGFRCAVPVWLPELRWVPVPAPERVGMCRMPVGGEVAA